METQEHLVQELAWLRRVVVGLVGDEATAADLSQEVALEALRRPPAAQGAVLEGARLRGWLWTMARRKAGRGRERTAAQARSEREAARSDATGGVARSAQQLEVHRELLSEISALDPDDASLITQRYLDQMPPREIARGMDLPIPTVRKRLSRAMERLRERLVRSDRGAEGWSLGLCLIVGSTGGPLPVGAEPGEVHGGEAPTLLGGASALKWAGLALILAGAGAALVWLSRSPEPLPDTGLGRSAEVELEGAEPQGPGALSSSTEVAATGREAVPAADPELGAVASAAATLSSTSPLRFVDEAGAPLASVRAVWADENWTPEVLSVDANGIAQLPEGARGFVYAGGDGLEHQSFRISWSDDGAMTAELRRQRLIPGRLLINGVEPGRKVTLWPGEIEYFAWPAEIGRDLRMKAVLREQGMTWTCGPIETGADGRFVYATHATLSEYLLSFSSEFWLISAEGCLPADPGAGQLTLHSDSKELLIDVRSFECVTGRLVWEDNQQPLTRWIDVYPLDGEGEWYSQYGPYLDLDGRFFLPVDIEPTDSSSEGEPWQALEIHIDDIVVTRRLDLPGEAHDLGTIEVPRAPVAHFLVQGRGGHGIVPLAAVVASDFGRVVSDGTGAAGVHAAVGSTIRVFAEGYGYREIVVASQAAFPSTPQVIELEPSARLKVRFELSHRVGFDPTSSVNVVLRMRTFAFAGGKGSKNAFEQFWRGYVRLTGQRIRFFDVEGDDWVRCAGEAVFQGVPGSDLWIDCLLPGATFDVELQDAFRQVLARQAVTMPLTSDTAVHSVDFGDLYEKEAAVMEVECLHPSTSEPFEGELYIVRGDGQKSWPKRTDKSGKFALGPVLPGQYRFMKRSRGRQLTGGGTLVTLVEGRNQVTVEAIDGVTGR